MCAARAWSKQRSIVWCAAFVGLGALPWGLSGQERQNGSWWRALLCDLSLSTIFDGRRGEQRERLYVPTMMDETSLLVAGMGEYLGASAGLDPATSGLSPCLLLLLLLITQRLTDRHSPARRCAVHVVSIARHLWRLCSDEPQGR